MPWIEVTEPFARPPRRPKTAPIRPWAGSLNIDRGLAELDGEAVNGVDNLDLDGCHEFEIRDASLIAQALTTDPPLLISAQRSRLDSCDLSGTTIQLLRGCTIASCKLIGTDLSGATVADVVFERCSLRYSNLRMAKLTRVQFIDCTLDEVDAFEMTAEDVSFPGSKLIAMNVDRLAATRVDLREASELTLNGARRLTGCLVAEHQLPAMAYSLALAVDLNLERHPAGQD